MKRFTPKHTALGLGLALMVLGLCGCGGGEPPVIPSQGDELVFVKIVGITNEEQPRSFMTEGHVAPGFTFESSMEYRPGTVHLIGVDRADYGDGLVFEKGSVVIIGDDGKPFLAPKGTALQVPITLTELSSQCWSGEMLVPEGSTYINLLDESDFGYTIELLHAMKGQWREIDNEGKPVPGDRDRLSITFHPIDLEKCAISWIGGAREAGHNEYRIIATNEERSQVLIKLKDSDPLVKLLVTVVEPQKQIQIQWADKKRNYEYLPFEAPAEEEDDDPVVGPTPVFNPTPIAPVEPVAPAAPSGEIAPNDVDTPVEVPAEPEPQPEQNLDPFG